MIQPGWFEVMVAAIGGATTVAGLLLTQTRIARTKLKQAENELNFQREALTFPEFVGEWAETHRDISDLMENTNVDRFMIFRAWNGLLEPRWTTSVYQLREGEQEPLAYIHFELDADYVDKLRHIVRKGYLYLTVEELEESAIKKVYETENVTGSYWAHLDSLSLPDSQSRAITYCSFATHVEGGLTPAELTRCRIVASRLRGLALAFDREVKAHVEEN